MEYPTTCLQCGKSFEGKRADTKYCSSTCRSRASRESNGDLSIQEANPDVSPERADLPDLPFSTKPSAVSYGVELEARLALLETRLGLLAGIGERLERLENQGLAVDRLQSRLSSLESGLTDLMEIAPRIKRIENEQVKLDGKLSRQPSAEGGSSPIARLSARLDALDARLSSLAVLPERLRILERRGSDSGELAGRIEALEARGQAAQRIQKTVSELQARIEAGLEEARNRKPLDSVGAQRMIEARIVPLEQRVERVAAQSRVSFPTDESRLIRLEQRVERLNAQVQAAPEDDVSGRLHKLERKLVGLQNRMEEFNADPDQGAAVVATLGERIDSVADDLSTLRGETIQLASWMRARLVAEDEEDDDEEPDWDEEDD